MKKLLLFVFPLIALFAIAYLFRTPDTDPDAMIAKYTNDQSRFVENDAGMRVHYRDQGNPNGVPIVLAHGTAASLHTWEPLVKLLGDEYRIITYSQPGHGLTGPHPDDDYSFAGRAEALKLVVSELGLERFVIGGNSMGGWIAWRYTIENPDKVAALILLDAAGAPLRAGEEEPEMNLGFRLLGSSIGRFLMTQYTPRGVIKKSALESVSVESVMTEAAVDRYWELLRYPGNRRAAGLGWSAPREDEYADRLGDIMAPTLIIWGAEDALVHASAATTFDERIPNADVVIYEGIGHLPMEEAAERTALDIDVFLERTVKRTE